MTDQDTVTARRAATIRRNAIIWADEVRPAVLELRDLGHSHSEIAAALNRRGLRTQRRSRWSTDQVGKFLRQFGSGHAGQTGLDNSDFQTPCSCDVR